MAVKSLKKGYLALAASMLLVAQAQATELLNSSYDVSRELFAALNPPFEQQWAKDNGGDKLTIKQSHAGSSKQALAILQGLKADVVTYNQVTDVQILHDKGNLIPAGNTVCRTTAHRSIRRWVSWCVKAIRKTFMTGTTWFALTLS